MGFWEADIRCDGGVKKFRALSTLHKRRAISSAQARNASQSDRASTALATEEAVFPNLRESQNT